MSGAVEQGATAAEGIHSSTGLVSREDLASSSTPARAPAPVAFPRTQVWELWRHFAYQYDRLIAVCSDPEIAERMAADVEARTSGEITIRARTLDVCDATNYPP